MMATTVGGFSYEVVPLSDRTKSVKTAPTGYAPTWKERVETIVATRSEDADFSRFMRRQAIRLKQDYYGSDYSDQCSSFASCEDAGWVDVSQTVMFASPDIISVSVGTSFYKAGMAHPNVQSARPWCFTRTGVSLASTATPRASASPSRLESGLADEGLSARGAAGGGCFM